MKLLIAIEFGSFEQEELAEPLSTSTLEDIRKALEWAEGDGKKLPKLGEV